MPRAMFWYIAPVCVEIPEDPEEPTTRGPGVVLDEGGTGPLTRRVVNLWIPWTGEVACLVGSPSRLSLSNLPGWEAVALDDIAERLNDAARMATGVPLG